MTLGAALALNILHFWLMRLRGRLTLERRALWLQASCRSVMRSMGIRYEVEGALPAHGLVVSNHLSYLDIVIYGAMMPCFFVSKAEVESWPYFGRAARNGGAMFLDRTKRTSVGQVAQQIAERLTLSVPVLLFPEGTSTDGRHVRHFHSALFEPAIAATAPVTTAAIRYSIDDGTAERELCWYGDAPFLPHLWKVLGTRRFSARIRFAASRAYPDRRAAAQCTHEEVVSMRESPEARLGREPIPTLPRVD